MGRPRGMGDSDRLGSHSHGTYWKICLKKTPTNNSLLQCKYSCFQLFQLPACGACPSFMLFKMFSTATGLLGSEVKHHCPIAVGAGCLGEVTCPLLPGSLICTSQQRVPHLAASALPFGEDLQGSAPCAPSHTLLAACVCGENVGYWELIKLGLNSLF